MSEDRPVAFILPAMDDGLSEENEDKKWSTRKISKKEIEEERHVCDDCGSLNVRTEVRWRENKK